MIQSIPQIRPFNTQQISALNGLQNAQQPNRILFTQTADHKYQVLNLHAMAQAINTVNNNNAVNFKGNKQELIEYLKAQVKSGDLNVKNKDCHKTIKTVDGKVYEVTVGTKKENDDIKELLSGLSDDETAYVKLKEQTQDKSDKEEELNFNYNVKEFNNNEKEKNAYATMKQKYGAI